MDILGYIIYTLLSLHIITREEENMKLSKFEREMKDILYFIREYGIQHIDFNVNKMKFDDKERNDFIYQVHKGFNFAQRNAVRLLQKVLLERKTLKDILKQARVIKNKEEATRITKEIDINKYQEMLIRKSVDAIAWQLFSCDLSVMKRLYGGQELIDITDSNLESELKVVEMYAKKEPETFVLISDLTTFIQVGDLVIMNPSKGVGIVELKEGKVNEKVFDLVERCIKQEVCLVHELSQENEKFIEHFKRTLNQLNKNHSVEKLIKTGSGKDLYTGCNTYLSKDEIVLSSYEDRINKLLLHSKKKGHAIDVIEECLLIGVYDIKRFPSKVFEFWKEACGIGMPEYDLRSSVYDPYTMPLFILPISSIDILDIIMGRTVIKMTLDIDKWLKTLENDGYSYRWMSKKETARLAIPHGKKLLFQLEGKGVEIISESGSERTYLGGGIFARMFTCFNNPSAIRYYLEETINAGRKLDEQCESV